jgi:hypothetical protein
MRLPLSSALLLRRALPPSPAAAPSAAFLRRLSSFAAPFSPAALCLPRQLRGSLIPPLPSPRAAAAPLNGDGAGVRGISTKRRRVRKMNKHRFQKRKKRLRNLTAKNLRTK